MTTCMIDYDRAKWCLLYKTFTKGFSQQQSWEIWSWIRILAENPSVVCMMFWGRLWLDSPMAHLYMYHFVVHIYHRYIYISICKILYVPILISPFQPWLVSGTSQVQRTAISTTCQLGTRRTWDRWNRWRFPQSSNVSWWMVSPLFWSSLGIESHGKMGVPSGHLT